MGTCIHAYVLAGLLACGDVDGRTDGLKDIQTDRNAHTDSRLFAGGQALGPGFEGWDWRFGSCALQTNKRSSPTSAPSTAWPRTSCCEGQFLGSFRNDSRLCIGDPLAPLTVSILRQLLLPLLLPLSIDPACTSPAAGWQVCRSVIHKS